MDDLLSEFLTETNESLSVLDMELVKLEQDPNDPELLSNIFRLMHTIKGTCGFLGLPRLESVAHAGENVLGKVRDGELEVTTDAVSIILECLDRIRSLLGALEETEKEPAGDDQELIGRLNALAENVGQPSGGSWQEPADEADAEEVSFEPVPASNLQTDVAEAIEEPIEALSDVASAEAAAVEVAETDVLDAVAGEPVEFETEPAVATAGSVAEAPVGKAPAPATPPKGQAGAETGAAAPKESAVANQSIRVNVGVLENLMTMVSELVLTRNQLLQILRTHKETEFTAPLQRLNHVVSELQEGVMQTRMQPIGNAWAKLPRIIRDLSHELDKKIDLVMKGQDTELDRQVLELIKDPLTHMVRNSADHGIEMPAERTAAGKKEVGTVELNAFHEGGHIIIVISDDGKGLNVERIKQKILDNGLATETELEGLSDQQINQFIFKPGFSTAEQVTAVSGRGVGMDVVRTNIEKIGGTVELTSVVGEGSKFTIKIPLTLAIVSALIVECCRERFAIPQISVIELVRASSNSEHAIEKINGTPVLRLRNRLLPLVNLRDLLHLENSAAQEGTPEQIAGELGSATRRDAFIVVAQVGAYTFGIIVDRVFDTEEIVVKPVAPILRDISLFSGNTILGDGAVVMILDPNGIAAQTGEISVAEGSQQNLDDNRSGGSEEKVAFLVFRADGESPKAVPLSLVARLEEVDRDKIEFSNGQNVVQYRGQLMPLVGMDGVQELSGDGRQPVLVFSDGGRSMGLVVDQIIDIVEEQLTVELTGDRSGYLGSAVIDGKATDIIDAGYFLNVAFKDWFGDHDGQPFGEASSNRVLLVDDSPFFRNLLAPLLSVAGYNVSTAAGPAEALKLCEAGESFDVIVSDIEMPGMDGFAFARAVRENSKWRDMPLVALSSHTSQQDMERGRAVGFNDYVAKNDRNALLTALQETLTDVRGAA